MKAKQKTWKDITLATAMELMKLEQQAADMEPIDFIIEKVAILTDKDPAEIENMRPDEIFELNSQFDFMSRLPIAKFQRWAKIGDEEYGIQELDKLTMAQMVDIEEYYKGGLENNIDKIASILILPVKEKGLLGKKTLAEYEYDSDRVEAVKTLDMEFVWSNILFFWTGVDGYTTGFTDFLEENKEMMMTQKPTQSWLNMLRKWTEKLQEERQSRTLKGMLARLSTRSGAGSAQSTRSAKAT